MKRSAPAIWNCGFRVAPAALRFIEAGPDILMDERSFDITIDANETACG
ncbi:hypothetical protein [Hoeflea sp. TYP-13]